jgi:hypothetical protein
MSDEVVFNHSHLRTVIRHIKLVQDATQLLGERLIDQGELKLGRQLIAKGLCHDQSKFTGIEWKALVRVEDGSDEISKTMLVEAWEQHVSTNDHHPEFWKNGINDMPQICIAEMVCDWFARSQEMGTDLRAWIKETASAKYDMSLKGRAYKQVKYFVDMLLDPQFKPIKATS